MTSYSCTEYKKSKCESIYYIVYFHFLIPQYHDFGNFLSIPI